MKTMPSIHRFPVACAIALLVLASAALSPSCRSSSSGGQGAVPLLVHPAYQLGFDAVKTALDDDQVDIARSTLARLRARIERDAETMPSLASAQTRQDSVAMRVLDGELPARENALAGLRMVAGFSDVVEGRARAEALDLEIELVRDPDNESGTASAGVELVVRSRWHQPLVLKPGAASVRMRRISVMQDTGSESVDRAVVALGEPIEIEVAPGGVARARLAVLPIEVPKGALATRMRVTIAFNGGHVAEGGDVLPAREINARPGERTDFPGWLPAAAVEPSALVDLVKRGNPPLNAALERAVRIAPSRRAEALDLLGAAVETMPASALRSSIPAIRWLANAATYHRDERDWRDFLIARYRGELETNDDSQREGVDSPSLIIGG